jgi:cobalt-precorrin 5A hydrolase
MIVAGIGCRKGATAAQVAAAVAAALARGGLTTQALSAMATPAAKGGEPGITSALGLPLVLVPQAALEAAGWRAATRSERVVALWNVPSVAEAAALAASGPMARLRVARCAVGPATCALADSEEAP